MRDCRKMWQFLQDGKHKKPLTSEEIRYWKISLLKNLKVGMEFEYNLPEATGSCKGDNRGCPCKHMGEDTCWRKCANEELCSSIKDISRCVHRTDTCEAEDCAKCQLYSIECFNIWCINFISSCLSCKSFEINCTDCPIKYDPKTNPDNIRKAIIEVLNPNNTYGQVNKSGVHSIVTDGSLLGQKGMEVITIGRRIDFWEFYHMANKIIGISVAKGAYTNERCSIHMHVLASYYSKMVSDVMDSVPNFVNELEKPMPEVILSNYHQLVRHYQNALIWMFMGLDDPKKMTRWEKFRVSILEISAALNPMAEVKQLVSSHAGGNKYALVNYNYTDFDKEGNVSKLHYENRGLDGILSPSAVAAIACLYAALLIKAVEISRYGVMEVGDNGWLTQAREIKESILNNRKDYQAGDRFSDTRNAMKYSNIMIADGLDMLRQIKHILADIGPAYEILEKLIQRPCALRRCAGESWEKIEKDLKITLTEEEDIITKIRQFIDLRLVHECGNIEEWMTVVAENIFEEYKTMYSDVTEVKMIIKGFINEHSNEGNLVWSNKLGTVVLI